jgi:hypothetical protein
MNECCIQSFVAKGIREHFRLSTEGATHRCETCGLAYVLQRNAELSTATATCLTWREVTH